MKKLFKKITYNQTKLINNLHIKLNNNNRKREDEDNYRLTPCPRQSHNLTTAAKGLSTFPQVARIPRDSLLPDPEIKKLKNSGSSTCGNVVNPVFPQPRYIFIVEKQKRGALHVHMISNKFTEYSINENGYRYLKEWEHGFSSVMDITDFDENFRTYLYLFKYMNKTQRIGRSFIHTSRNFDKIETLDYSEFINILSERKIVYTEDNEFTCNGQKRTLNKKYYKITSSEN